MAVDLTALFPPAGRSGNFGVMNLRSESSASETSELSDRVQPLAIAVPSTCAASIETVPSTPAGGQPAGTVTDQATVTASGGITPAGTVTFELFRPNDADCTGGAIFTSVATPLPAASPFTATSAPPFTPTAAGTYRWVATFNSTNPGLAGVASGCQDEPATINPPPPPPPSPLPPTAPVPPITNITVPVTGRCCSAGGDDLSAFELGAVAQPQADSSPCACSGRIRKPGSYDGLDLRQVAADDRATRVRHTPTRGRLLWPILGAWASRRHAGMGRSRDPRRE